jgi:hypothetical protein
MERWTSTKEHGHAVKVKPTTREALFRAVWWLVPSKKPRSEFRNASLACPTLSLSRTTLKGLSPVRIYSV